MDIRPKSFIKRVFDFAVAELERRAQKPSSPAPSPFVERGGTKPFPYGVVTQADASTSAQADVAPEPLEPRAHTPAAGLEVMRNERGSVRVRWAVKDTELERSAGLIDEGAVLCLRLVSFDAARDHVTRDVQDRPAVAHEGECDLGRLDGRAVIALGLRAGGRFVSIAHHVM